MSEDFLSVFRTPAAGQLPLLIMWLEKHVGKIGTEWHSSSPEASCSQLIFCQSKHRRMFDFYAELQGISVYSSLTDYRAAQTERIRQTVCLPVLGKQSLTRKEKRSSR